MTAHRFNIDYQCPQCGAPANLDEDARILDCRFCRVRSLITAEPFFRYTLPSHAPAGKKLIWFPYWRFKGMVFLCSASGITNRFADISLQAVGSLSFPVSVGLRSQTQALRVLSPDLEGEFLKPVVPLKTVVGQLPGRFASEHDEAVAYEAVIGETSSLIYAPFYPDRALMDGLTNKFALPGADELPDLSGLAREQVQPGIRFIPAMCPECGCDLEAAADALVLKCMRCETLWQVSRQGLSPVHPVVLAGEGPGDIYLPFWRIQAQITGIALDTMADLARFANLPVAVKPSWQSIRFRFWCPAFKLRPGPLIQTASRVTLSQWRLPLERRFPEGRLFSVNLPLGQAAKSMVLVLAHVIRPSTEMEEMVKRIKITPRRSSLVFLPFRETGPDYVQDRLSLAVNKTMAGLAAVR
ncbi:hypothetical protein [uncultured Desulfobacter sp.]|uniref:hypothetical protein n=1 Tax=uncultured Desulfobacter sp. TaxID=240139 RepID=UPI002AAC4143|nr:hypothetical protein [uncultured Desulfobacter sp.]